MHFTHRAPVPARPRGRHPRAGAPAAWIAAALWACAAWACAPALAQPDRQQRIGRTVADEASPHYRFQHFRLAGPDGAPRWQVRLGIPTAAAPAAGFPALYMLDGNAALMEFDAGLLAQLAQAAPPVLVFIAHDNDLRIDGPARTADYTPSAAAHGAEGEVQGGGAAEFAQAIVERIQPQVRERARIDTAREALWGHSFGGLFVLDTLYRRSDAFDAWIAASPSLWWDQARQLGAPEREFAARPPRAPVQVLILQGERERYPQRFADRDGRDRNDPRVAAHLARIAAAPADATQALAPRLDRLPTVSACYRMLPDLGHGPMLGASVRVAARALAQPKQTLCAVGPASRVVPPTP